MSILHNFFSKIKAKMQRPSENLGYYKIRNNFNLLGSGTYDTYASAYPSIRAISNEFMTIRPYAIDSNGKKIENTQVINALYRPNQLDSPVSFREKLAVMNLVHRNTYLLVWRSEKGEARAGGTITPQNIAGFTFLEGATINRRDGRTYYSIGSQEFSDAEVITIPGGVDPYNLYGGYSSCIASMKWARLDDYIADYQSGFFQNGAIPSGQFIITGTKEEFNDTVDMMQSRYRGAENNNNVSYVHRPIDRTGKPVVSQVEWVPFASPNKDIDFKNLFDQANKRLDLAFGVHQIIKGVDNTAIYATAQVAESGFKGRVVYPLALRIYSQITHELNRITNGLGVAITFDYKANIIVDEEKVKAETTSSQLSTLLEALNYGFTLDSAVEALKLPTNFKLFKEGENKNAIIENDKPDVDDGNEVKKAPDPEKIDGVSPINKVKKIKPKNKLTEAEQLELTTRRYMQSQIDKAIEEYKELAEFRNEIDAEATEDQRQEFIEAMMIIIVAILASRGDNQYSAGIALLKEAGVDISNLESFKLSDTARDSYRAYMGRVGDTYGQDTAKAIRAVLDQSNIEGWTKRDTEKALNNIMSTDEWRVKRLARTEFARSESIGSVEAMKQLQSETGQVLEKSLYHSAGTACQYCEALDGVWVKVEQPIVSLGDGIIGTEGGILVNDFVENDGFCPHPNGKGALIYRVVEQ